MGLLTGSASTVRYMTANSAPDDIKDFALQQLTALAFKEIDPLSLTEKSIGWVSFENMACTFFDDLHFAKDPYLVFSLRIDIRRVPPLTLKAALLREELKFKKATGSERLRKKDRDMLKDEVWQSLIKKALPVPSLYDICWNTSTGMIYFFSNAAKANDEFVNYFFRSFNLKLVPLGPHNLAGLLGRAKKRDFSLQDHGMMVGDG